LKTRPCKSKGEALSLRHILAALAIAFSGLARSDSAQLPAATAVEIVTGTEPVAWEQTALNLRDLWTLKYLAYGDGVRVARGAASCGTTATASGFPCVSPLPPLTSGRHTIELAAI